MEGLKGTETSDHRRSQRGRRIGPLFPWEVPSVFFAFIHLLLRRLVQLVAGSSNRLDSDVEVVVLRHQLRVLRRQVGRPRLRRRDRLFMAAISRTLPRARWSSFVVSPNTLLRWHRELVRRKWTFRRASTAGRPPISQEVRDLILRMGRDNPQVGVHQDPGRARQARHKGLGNEDPYAAAWSVRCSPSKMTSGRSQTDATSAPVRWPRWMPSKEVKIQGSCSLRSREERGWRSGISTT